MISPLQIEFHNTPPLEPVESRIRQELAEIEKFYNRLVSCRIDVEAPEHERRGSVCKVRIDLGLPTEDAKAWAELQGLDSRARRGPHAGECSTQRCRHGGTRSFQCRASPSEGFGDRPFETLVIG